MRFSGQAERQACQVGSQSQGERWPENKLPGIPQACPHSQQQSKYLVKINGLVLQHKVIGPPAGLRLADIFYPHRKPQALLVVGTPVCAALIWALTWVTLSCRRALLHRSHAVPGSHNQGAHRGFDG